MLFKLKCSHHRLLGSQPSFQGLTWIWEPTSSCKFYYVILTFKSCPKLYHFRARFCQDLQEKKNKKKKKKWVEEVALPAPFKASLRDRTEQGVMCGRAAPKQAHGRNSSAGCWADCLTDLLVEVVWWAPSPLKILIRMCKPVPINVCAVTCCYSAYKWKKHKAEYAVHTPDMQKSTSNFTKQENYVRLKHELMKTKLLGLWKRLTAVKGFSKCWHLVSPSTVPPTVSHFTYSYTKKQCNWSLTPWSNIF